MHGEAGTSASLYDVENSAVQKFKGEHFCSESAVRVHAVQLNVNGFRSHVLVEFLQT